MSQQIDLVVLHIQQRFLQNDSKARSKVSHIKELISLAEFYGVNKMPESSSIKQQIELFKEQLKGEEVQKNIKPMKKSAREMLDLYKPLEVFKFSENLQSGKLQHNKQTRFLSELLKSGEQLKEIILVNQKKIERVVMLEKNFPNFVEVIEYLVDNLTLQLHGKGYAYFEPLLLVGKPGIGKTEFLSNLANVLEVSSHYLNVGSMNANWTLAGADPGWRDAQAGMIARNLINEDAPNFIFQLDEIDKVINNIGNGGDPLASLYELLEHKTAKSFVDANYGEQVTFDASLINFVASANDISKISNPILSRFNVFEVNSPSGKELIPVINNIHLMLLKSLRLEGKIDVEIRSAVFDRLQNLVPREIKKSLKKAYAKALQDNRSEILVEDLVGIMELHEAQNNGIGFMARLH